MFHSALQAAQCWLSEWVSEWDIWATPDSLWYSAMACVQTNLSVAMVVGTKLLPISASFKVILMMNLRRLQKYVVEIESSCKGAIHGATSSVHKKLDFLGLPSSKNGAFRERKSWSFPDRLLLTWLVLCKMVRKVAWIFTTSSHNWMANSVAAMANQESAKLQKFVGDIQSSWWKLKVQSMELLVHCSKFGAQEVRCLHLDFEGKSWSLISSY